MDGSISSAIISPSVLYHPDGFLLYIYFGRKDYHLQNLRIKWEVFLAGKTLKIMAGCLEDIHLIYSLKLVIPGCMLVCPGPFLYSKRALS